MPTDDTQSEPSVVTALGRAIDAGQRIVVNRIDLARLDMLDVLGRATRGGILIVLGGVLVGVGWLAFSSAAIIYGQQYLTLPTSAALVGAVNATIGIIVLSIGIQRMRPTEAANGTDKG